MGATDKGSAVPDFSAIVGGALVSAACAESGGEGDAFWESLTESMLEAFRGKEDHDG